MNETRRASQDPAWCVRRPETEPARLAVKARERNGITGPNVLARGGEFVSVAFRSAKVASKDVVFSEQSVDSLPGIPIHSQLGRIILDRWLGWVLQWTVAMLPVVAMLLVNSSQAATAQDELPTALSGIESSERFEVVDHRPWQNQSEYLLRLLYRVGQVSERSLDRFETAQDDSFWQKLNEQAQTYRFRVVRVIGRARFVVPVRLDESVGADFKGYYRVQVATATGESVWLVCRSVPRAWSMNEPIDEPIVARGFFLALVQMPDGCNPESADAARSESPQPTHKPSGEAPVGPGVPVIVVRRPAWFPDRVDESKGITASQVWLAKHGVDIGQLDQLRRRFHRPLGRNDAAPLFQMLAATRGKDSFPGSETVSLFDLLQQPAKHVGQAVRIEGHVRRVIRIEVENDDWAQRLGLGYYYELDVFVPLADQRIVIKHRPADDDQAEPVEIVYENRFPVTVCVAELPAEPNAIRGKRIIVEGFLYRFWSYQSAYTSRVHPDAGQISPLIVGTTPKMDEASRLTIDWILGTAMVGVALGLVALIWYARRDDRIVTNVVRIRHETLPDQLEGLDALITDASASADPDEKP